MRAAMRKEDLKRLAENPDFISGIYNYCDRWCERCPFTARCLNYALGRANHPDAASRDIHNERFWEQISGMLQLALDLLHEMAEEDGIDPDAIDTTEIMAEEKRRQEDAAAHSIATAAQAYGEMVDRWFEAGEELFRKAEEAFQTAARLNLLDVDPASEANALAEAVHVVRWYQHQIWVKLMRALQGRDDETAFQLDDFPKDSDGSAKVALVGIDRSMAVWGYLLRAFSERETETLEILVHLERLRRDVETAFPRARAFVRPGFDTPQIDGVGCAV